jgi:hypothetical protein
VATIYVKPDGSDANNGTSEAQAVATLSRCVDLLFAGDTGLFYPGVYKAGKDITRAGTAQNPITLMAKDGYGSVIISHADNSNPISGAFRNGTATWTLHGTTYYGVKVYWATCTWDPSRVMADWVDCYNYPSLQDLMDGRIPSTYVDAIYNSPVIYVPGPRGGYFFDSGANRLYVALDPRYGNAHPSGRLMQVGPAKTGGGFNTTVVDTNSYGIGIKDQVNGHIVIDGFKFESCNVAAIFMRTTGNITVKNCASFGDRFLIHANGGECTSVTLQNCEWSAFPTFHDGLETLTDYDNDPSHFPNFNPFAPVEPWFQFCYWARKFVPTLSLEFGPLRNIGTNWVIDGCYFHDLIDGLSGPGTGTSVDLVVKNCKFQRLLDNVIELDGPAIRVIFEDNKAWDCLEPWSYQPVDLGQLANGCIIRRSVYNDSSQWETEWLNIKTIGNWDRGLFKFHLGSAGSSITIPNGLLFQDNEFLMTYGTFMTAVYTKFGPVTFKDNYIITGNDFTNYTTAQVDGFKWTGPVLVDKDKFPSLIYKHRITVIK